MINTFREASYAIPSSEELMSKMVDPAGQGGAADDSQSI